MSTSDPWLAALVTAAAAELAHTMPHAAARLVHAQAIVRAGGVTPSTRTAQGWHVTSPWEPFRQEVEAWHCTCLDLVGHRPDADAHCVHFLAARIYALVVDALRAPCQADAPPTGTL